MVRISEKLSPKAKSGETSGIAGRSRFKGAGYSDYGTSARPSLQFAVHMWKRMPVHRRRGPRGDRSPLLSAGRAPKARKPECGQLGPTRSWEAPDQSCASRRNVWTFSGGRPAQSHFCSPQCLPLTNHDAVGAGKLCTKTIVFNVLFLKASTASADFWG